MPAGTEAKDIKACVGMWKWRAFAFVARESCPLDPSREYCFEMGLGEPTHENVCLHFCEVETIDWMSAVKCDHPKAVSDYG